MKKELGGERLGTGAKIKVDLHGWGRSTFNQSREWRSTMGVGMGVPCFKEIGLNGTTFEIDLKTAGYTIPTIAPLFGEFKLQIDMFACPIRLYQGILHNNAVNIGLEMKKVLLPTFNVGAGKTGRTSTSSLINYLGIRGVTLETNNFNAIPLLAYYDIYKNYYANKQEENAKVIAYSDNEQKKLSMNNAKITISGETTIFGLTRNSQITGETFAVAGTAKEIKGGTFLNFQTDGNTYFGNNMMFRIYNANTNIYGRNQKTGTTYNGFETYKIQNSSSTDIGEWYYKNEKEIEVVFYGSPTNTITTMQGISFYNYQKGITIENFPLTNIDEARRKILSFSSLNQQIDLNTDLNIPPYNINFEEDDTEMAIKEMNGLFLKTYLSDIYNNWLSNENVEFINNISQVQVDGDGNFSMDALILAKKIYNLLNRIAVSGGTYEDWQESVYGQKAITRAESPIYIGGTSAIIQFQEVVSTSESGEQPLGSLGGRGIMNKRKGGKIIYKCNEPTIILGIASLTPKIDYYQGNHWFLTEIENMDNFHKPELDGIGFANLIANQVHWADSRNKALAKTTAWINYQTAINEVYGYFAEPEDDTSYKSLGHMVLRRDYETDTNGNIIDFTTYIDPEKYNKVFAGNQLTDQNFWIQIGFDVKSRRVMAAYEIPNL